MSFRSEKVRRSERRTKGIPPKRLDPGQSTVTENVPNDDRKFVGCNDEISVNSKFSSSSSVRRMKIQARLEAEKKKAEIDKKTSRIR